MRKSVNNNGIAFGPRILPQRTLGMAAVWLAAGLLSESAVGLDPVAVLAPSDVPPGWTNDFGWSVAISGRYVAVGAPRDPWFNGDATGAVYVFRREGARWIEQAKLTASDPEWQAQLGWSVAMEGDVIVAGAPSLEFQACEALAPGAAYVFRRNDRGTPDDLADDTWGEEAKLTVPPIYGINSFGGSVALSGDTAVVGSHCGAAGLFRIAQDTWNHQITFISPDGLLDDNFGSAVGIDSNRVAIGAFGHNDRRGATYIFANFDDAWYLDEKVTAPDAQPLDDFGRSVAIRGAHLIVGAPNEDALGPNSNSGAAYLFVPDNNGVWARQCRIQPTESIELSHFSSGVAVDGQLAVIARRSGSWSLVHLLTENTCTELNHLDGIPSNSRSTVAMEGKFAVLVNRIYAIRERNDLQSFTAFQECFGQQLPKSTPSTCTLFDANGNGAADITDFGEFLSTFTGP